MMYDHAFMNDWIICRDTFSVPPFNTFLRKFYYMSYITHCGYFYVVMIIIIQSHYPHVAFGAYAPIGRVFIILSYFIVFNRWWYDLKI